MPAKMQFYGWTPGKNYPTTASPGSNIQVYCYFTNVGDVEAYWFVSLVDRDTGTTVDEKDRLPPNFPALKPGWSTADSCYGTMPNRTWNLRFNVGHFENNSKVIDDYRDFTIALAGVGPKLLIISSKVESI